VVDMMMNVKNVEIAALFRQENELKMKISLRSKGRFEVLSLAEKWGGGGHLFAAGSTIETQDVNKLKSDLEAWLNQNLK
jgi:bifunctional oligoribonuclease and PAP phosphatase NrnA